MSDVSTAELSTEDMNRSLYEIVGGEPVVKKVVDTFYLLLVTDPVVGPKFFHHITMSRMRHLQLNHICNLLGGPQEVNVFNRLIDRLLGCECKRPLGWWP
jgi:hypothetical protein